MLRERDLLDVSYCRDADAKIARRIRELAEYEQARTIFSYVAAKREIDTIPCMRQMIADGKTVAVPRCVSAGVMEARRIRNMQELRPGRYGILEPSSDAPIIAPDRIDLVLVPCVGGNEQGQRIGYGGGFYDSYLAVCPAVRVLLCRALSMTYPIPMEPHDAVMDIVVSERGVIYTNKERQGRRGSNFKY